MFNELRNPSLLEVLLDERARKVTHLAEILVKFRRRVDWDKHDGLITVDP